MKTFRVLVAADGSPPAVRAATMLAEMLVPGSAEVLVLAVLSFELDPYTLLGEELSDTRERLRNVEETVEHTTGEVRRILEEAGHKVSATHRFGNPADEIIEEIIEWRPDLAVLGRRGLSGPSRWLLGSVSERVVRHAQVPVLVVS